MKKVCIVGGGIAGLFAARVLANKGFSVQLLEGAPSVGGLLRSFTGEFDQDFDYGTHIMRQTGVQEVDELLFSHLSKDWRSFEVLKTGSVSNGELYSQSAFINSNTMAERRLEQALKEFLECLPPEGSVESAGDYLRKAFGETFSKELFSPALVKFFGVSPEELHENALRQFGLTRMVAFTPEKTKELKKDSWGDQRLAFHDFNEGSSGLLNYYPRQGGVGLFIETLEKELTQLGVDVRCGQKIESVNSVQGRITGLRTQDELFEFDHLVWSLPVPMLNRLSQVKSASSELKFRDVALFYFTFKKPLKTELYYIMNFDPNMKSFRITFYQNLKDSNETHFSCCVEVLGERAEIEDLSLETILDELVSLGLVEKGELPVSSLKKSLPNGFPVLTKGFAASSQQAYDEALEHYSNVTFVGRSSGKVFFTNDILIDTFRLMNQL